MNRGPIGPTAISLAWVSSRPSAFARRPQQERRRDSSGLKRSIGGLLLGAMFAASQINVVPAYADEAQLQRQIDGMKRQLEAMQRELAQTRKQSAQQASAVPRQANAAPAQVVTARNGNEVIIPPPQPPAGAPIPTKTFPTWFDGIHVSMAGSFIALE